MTDKSVLHGFFEFIKGLRRRYEEPRRWTIKIYTGTGDHGKTSLFSGERVSKAHKRLEACGDVDELNAVLGALGASLSDEDPNVAREIQEIQSTLFHVGACLATTPGVSFGGFAQTHRRRANQESRDGH